MTVIVREDSGDVASTVADRVEALLRNNKSPRLGVATGATFEPVYEELLRRHRWGLDLTDAALFLLDEYVGLSTDHAASYRQFILTRFATAAGVNPERVMGPDGGASDPESEAARYEAIVLSDSIDLQLLGVGRNGHIGFNEPGSSLAGPTRPVRLSRSTRVANSRYFGSLAATPTRAITQGVGTIMGATSILLVACGEEKASSIAGALEGPITTAVPASALQLHPDVTCVLDRAAASELSFTLEHSGQATSSEGRRG